VDQAPKLLGITVDATGLLTGAAELVSSLGEANAVTALIGVGTIVTLVVIRRFAPRVPGALVVVVAGITLVAIFGLEDEVATVGAVPSGLPHVSVPALDLVQAGNLAVAALAIALVAFADTSVLSRSYATRLGDRVNQDQELFALGAVNVAAGLFQGFPISSSSSRTPAAEAAGARTQLTGVTAAVAIGLVLVFATEILAPLPSATLAGIVMVAVMGLIDLPALRRLLDINRPDFALAIAALFGVALVGVVAGIGIAVGLSAGALLWRAWHPHTAVLGRVDGLKGYHDRERHPEGRQIPGLVLFRFDAPLFFANADRFREGVLDAIEEAEPPIRRVVVAAEPMTDVDSTAEDMLSDLIGQLERGGIGLSFAELKGPVKDKVVRYGLEARLARPPFPRTLGEAVHAYLAEHRVPWTDWEDAD
jgi:MFS superfamily sulfate permease-like transporter